MKEKPSDLNDLQKLYFSSHFVKVPELNTLRRALDEADLLGSDPLQQRLTIAFGEIVADQEINGYIFAYNFLLFIDVTHKKIQDADPIISRIASRYYEIARIMLLDEQAKNEAVQTMRKSLARTVYATFLSPMAPDNHPKF